MILSVPEGDDKPLKYPLMFSICDVVLINKIDALSVFDTFSMERVRENILMRNPNATIIPSAPRRARASTSGPTGCARACGVEDRG